MSGNPLNFKKILRREAISACYAGLGVLVKMARSKKLELKASTIQRYLSADVKAGRIFDAGKGWYSTLAAPLGLAPEPVRDVSALLKREFPALNVACWSTRQLTPYMQHLMVKHFIFVSAPRSGLETVGQALEEAGYTVFVNPGKAEAKKVIGGEKVVVLRPSGSLEPGTSPFAAPEKVMVDLHIEAQKLYLMDGYEAGLIVKRMLESKRTEISKLFSYAKRRKLVLSRFLEGSESLFYTFYKKTQKRDF